MSLTLALRTALSGLTVTQTALQLTSDNITNAGTEGYTRKSLEVESRRIQTQGAGVQAGEISRAVDAFVIDQIRAQVSTVGELSVRDQYLRQIQNLFGSPENNRTISSSLNELQSALEATALTPEFAANSVEAVEIARQLAQLFNELAGTAQQLRADADNEIARLVGIVDQSLKDVAELNLLIARSKTLGQSSASLEDDRDRAISKIAELIDIRTSDNTDGTTTVFTSSGQILVNGGIATDLAHTAAAQVSASINYLDPADPNYPGAITGIFVNGSTAAGDDITTEISGGQLKALIDMRDAVLPNLQSEIDSLAQELLSQFNAIHNGGTAFPPPSSLTGSHSFTTGDVFSAAGSVRVAVLSQADGAVVETLDIALGGFTTVNDVVTAIDAMTNVSASLNANGQLVVTADNPGEGIAINELDGAVTTIGTETRGVSHFFGLNDLFQANVSGTAYDAFATAQLASSTTALGLTGALTFAANGVATVVNYTAGDSLDDVAASINANGTLSGANITAIVVNDGGGRRLVIQDTDGDNFRVTDSGTFLTTTGMSHDQTSVATVLAVNARILTSPTQLARAELSDAGGLAAGDVGISEGDATTASSLAGLFNTDIGFTASGGQSATTTTLSRYAASVLAVQSTLAGSAKDEMEFNTAFLSTLEFRNSSISGVNIDEELANLVILEQAFNASARVITVTAEMLEELIGIVR